jgi:hypothetical protein
MTKSTASGNEIQIGSTSPYGKRSVVLSNGNLKAAVREFWLFDPNRADRSHVISDGEVKSKDLVLHHKRLKSAESRYTVSKLKRQIEQQA